MIKHILLSIGAAIVGMFTALGVLTLASPSIPQQKPGFYVHATHNQDTITVRFSDAHVYVLDYHPVAMQGNLRSVGITTDISESKEKCIYATSIGSFELLFEDNAPVVLIYTPADLQSPKITYKVLP